MENRTLYRNSATMMLIVNALGAITAISTMAVLFVLVLFGATTAVFASESVPAQMIRVLLN